MRTLASRTVFWFTWHLFIDRDLSILGAIVSEASWINGTCFYFVIFILVLQIDLHVAITFSLITAFGIACGRFIVLLFMRHNNQQRLLINYPIVLTVDPLTIYSMMIRIVFDIVSPISLSIVTLTGFTINRTF